MSKQGNFGRRTWDREEYAERAKLRHQNGSSSQTPQPSKAAQLKEFGDVNLDFQKDLNKRILISSQNLSGTRGKKFGFYCESCDVTFKDNLKYVQHLNSTQHLVKTGGNRKQKDVTLEDVIARYEKIVREIDGVKPTEQGVVVETKGESIGNEQDEQSEEDEMSKMMGFKGFGTTKK